jgi:hypothetical protein
MSTGLGESRGARLLRELEQAFGTLSPEQRRAIVEALRDTLEGRSASPPVAGSAAGAA